VQQKSDRQSGRGDRHRQLAQETGATRRSARALLHRVAEGTRLLRGLDLSTADEIASGFATMMAVIGKRRTAKEFREV